ncbi:MAG: RimK family protein [Candidatus Eisenbacteria bacterium]
MPDRVVLVDKLSDWKPGYPDVRVVAARDYIDSPGFAVGKGLSVINLCRSYRYLSLGYYCSLLAEARGQRIIPTVRTMNDLSRKSIYSLDLADLDAVVSKRLAGLNTPALSGLEIEFFFGWHPDPALGELARQLFDVFRVPLMQAEFKLQGKWRLTAIRPLYLQALDGERETLFLSGLDQYLNRRWREPKARRQYRYDVAMLHDPNEKLPPSDGPALKEFVKAGNRLGVNVDLIEKKDYGRVPEYDALFIRETTGINHHTYRFAKRAETEGIPVIDDPESILKCTNKIYLAELLRTHDVPTPRSAIVRKDALGELEDAIPFPVVLKIPDGSFSRGVFKIESHEELERMAGDLFKSSDLILAQEFVYTAFDWRIGVLNRKPIFACQYFMSDRHWQIIKHGTAGRYQEGDWKTVPVDEAPSPVIEAALKAANLIGDGLYGVDVKQHEGRVMVMEVNENPNIEAEVEDGVLGARLYEMIIEDIVRRIEARRGR